MAVNGVGATGAMSSIQQSIAPRGQEAIGRPQTPATGSIQNTRGNTDGAKVIRGGVQSATPNTPKPTLGGLVQGNGLLSSSSGGLMSLGKQLDVLG